MRMNKKADFKLEMIFIAALMFGVIFVAGLGVYAEALNNYDVEVDTSTTWGKMSYNAKEINQRQTDVRNKLQGGIVTDESAVDEMVKGGYTGIRNNPFSVVSIASNATMTFFQESPYVPDIFTSLFLLIFSIIVAFSIVAIIFRFRTGGA